MTRIVVIDSGVANLASVTTALRALGAEVEITGDPRVVTAAPYVVLPGVGAFGTAMEALCARGLDEAVRRVHAADTPLLAICLGMQLLGEGSAESPGVGGIGVIPGRFEPLPETVTVPHLGWNVVDAEAASGLPSGYAAFANSYCLPHRPDEWAAAWTTHGTRFAAALAKGRTLACQFHPELSGAYGRTVLERWLDPARALPPATSTRDGGSVRRIVPCLDVTNGRVVKGISFQDLRDAGDPAENAARYEREGADEIVLLDIGAAPEDRSTQLETVRAVRSVLHIPLTVGGGVRSVGDARALLAAGADKVSVNTAALRRPTLLTELADAFGTQCVVLAIDARRVEGAWEALAVGGREVARDDAVGWAAEGAARGAGEILLTSWDRDGTRAGCDLPLLRAVREAVRVPVIASGGVGTRQHVADAFATGADAVLAASVFHDADDSVDGIKAYLTASGVSVRR